MYQEQLANKIEIQFFFNIFFFPRMGNTGFDLNNSKHHWLVSISSVWLKKREPTKLLWLIFGLQYSQNFLRLNVKMCNFGMKVQHQFVTTREVSALFSSWRRAKIIRNNWSHKNIPNRQQCVHFRKGQKVTIHSTLTSSQAEQLARLLSYLGYIPGISVSPWDGGSCCRDC